MKSPNIKIFFVPILFLLTGCFDNATPETYIIPDGYQGRILIVYDQAKGRDEEFIGNRRVYRIDSNGMLVTKFKSEDGIIDEEYYYQEADGLKKRIGIDSSIFWHDTLKVREYKTKNYNTILIRSFGVSGGYGSGSDFPHKVDYSESTIATEKFMDSFKLSNYANKQWGLINDMLNK